MAVIVKELNKETYQLDPIGVFYNGEFTGKVTTQIQIEQMDLDDYDDPEAELVRRYNSHVLQAVKVDDEEVDPDDYSGDYIDHDIDPEEYI